MIASGNDGIGHVEQLIRIIAGKADPENLSHSAVGPVATDDVGVRRALCAIAPPQNRFDLVAHFRDIVEAHLPFDRDAELAQSIEQEPLVLVLREGQQKRIRAQTRPHVGQ